MHGFESVVGPVKGVFDKEMSLNKAREHTLLRSDRPPYVTILSLGQIFCCSPDTIVTLWFKWVQRKPLPRFWLLPCFFYIVRDAAARLPNGEGTRAEICELLKDSQFLAPDVTSAQVGYNLLFFFFYILWQSDLFLCGPYIGLCKSQFPVADAAF